MAARGSVKELSVRHEDFIAKLLDGVRSKSSGAADHDYADVKTDTHAIECKMTMTKRKPVLLQQFEKVALEAWEHGQEPMMALRWHFPGSPLADGEGWIDLTVRLAREDADRDVPI